MKTVKVEFKSKKGCRISDNEANLYGQHIFKILKKRSINSITAKEVLEDAKHIGTPYHEHFNWDDTSAAEEFRISQARQLISSIVEIKIIKEEEIPVRVFVNVIDAEGDRVYVPTKVAMAKPQMANQVISQALREVKTWSNKYKEYCELANVRDAIGNAEEKFIITED